MILFPRIYVATLNPRELSFRKICPTGELPTVNPTTSMTKVCRKSCAVVNKVSAVTVNVKNGRIKSVTGGINVVDGVTKALYVLK